MKKLELIIGIVFVILSFAVAVLFINISSVRSLSNLENASMQGFSLLAGLFGSFLFGRQSARNAASDIIKPHARSAFRRLFSLYNSLSRVATAIESADKSASLEDHRAVLVKLEAIVIEQIATADDALEDWRDIVPEDVDELHQRISYAQKSGGRK